MTMRFIKPTDEEVKIFKNGSAFYQDGHAYYIYPFALQNYNDNGVDNFEFIPLDELPDNIKKQIFPND